MRLQQKVRNIIANPATRLGDVFRSKASIQKKKDSLLGRIQSGQFVEELFRSEVWGKVLEPYLDKIRNKARFDLENDHSLYGEKDVGRYYPRGAIHTITEIKSVLKETINQAQIARQALSFLQKEEKEQDNARG